MNDVDVHKRADSQIGPALRKADHCVLRRKVP